MTLEQFREKTKDLSGDTIILLAYDEYRRNSIVQFISKNILVPSKDNLYFLSEEDEIVSYDAKEKQNEKLDYWIESYRKAMQECDEESPAIMIF